MSAKRQLSEKDKLYRLLRYIIYSFILFFIIATIIGTFSNWSD